MLWGVLGVLIILMIGLTVGLIVLRQQEDTQVASGGSAEVNEVVERVQKEEGYDPLTEETGAVMFTDDVESQQTNNLLTEEEVDSYYNEMIDRTGIDMKLVYAHEEAVHIYEFYDDIDRAVETMKKVEPAAKEAGSEALATYYSYVGNLYYLADDDEQEAYYQQLADEMIPPMDDEIDQTPTTEEEEE